ncbi:MAG: nucleotide exchange factor GrpE [Cytophagales bacterium]|nr:nucleotide exchange factor GrpE [Bernardetiaceae bacterium]MDW8210026.1 nucleotide exchange factor GrpE [Cytophagales bacterium]
MEEQNTNNLSNSLDQQADSQAQESNNNTHGEASNSTAAQAEHHEHIPPHMPEPEPIQKLKEELNEVKDKYLRLYADFENYRKRVAKERQEFLVMANEELILKLLPVLDDFERAQKSLTTDTQSNQAMRQGFELIYTKLLKVLESKGLKSFSAQGEVFNPDLHEAITQVAAPSEEMKGKVVEEVEKGYILGEKVIRFAKVVVGT